MCHLKRQNSKIFFQNEPHENVILGRTVALDVPGAYCNALLLAHWSVQKLNHVSPVQLRRSVCAFTFQTFMTTY